MFESHGLFNVCHLDFDLMNLVLKLSLDMMVTYFYTKNEVKSSFSSNINIWKQVRQILADMSETFTYPLSQAVIMHQYQQLLER